MTGVMFGSLARLDGIFIYRVHKRHAPFAASARAISVITRRRKYNICGGQRVEYNIGRYNNGTRRHWSRELRAAARVPARRRKPYRTAPSVIHTHAATAAAALSYAYVAPSAAAAASAHRSSPLFFRRVIKIDNFSPSFARPRPARSPYPRSFPRPAAAAAAAS